LTVWHIKSANQLPQCNSLLLILLLLLSILYDACCLRCKQCTVRGLTWSVTSAHVTTVESSAHYVTVRPRTTNVCVSIYLLITFHNTCFVMLGLWLANQWRSRGDAGMRPHPSQLGQKCLNDYILGMYDCSCLTTPGCRQCTPVDINNKSIFH